MENSARITELSALRVKIPTDSELWIEDAYPSIKSFYEDVGYAVAHCPILEDDLFDSYSADWVREEMLQGFLQGCNYIGHLENDIKEFLHVEE
jgi:hypothetical protein